MARADHVDLTAKTECDRYLRDGDSKRLYRLDAIKALSSQACCRALPIWAVL